MKRVVFARSDNRHGLAETMWADEIGNNLYVLRNIPFSTYGIAEGDVVEANESDDELQVVRLHTDSGNGTLWFSFPNTLPVEQQKAVLKELSSVGCTYERATSTDVAVTVPPNLQIPFEQLLGYLGQVTEEGMIRGWIISKEPSGDTLTS